ncbi:MAG: phosphoribosylaminoimidazole carboxylase PurE protein [Arenicella sp.]|jgi:phosphoribosylaminoimidazole carboxylase PurE protein
MQAAAEILTQFNIEFQAKVVSAHRTPEDMVAFAKAADVNGYSVIIAGAGGAAHLPGMVASCTTLPVIGVPVAGNNQKLDGMDSLLSIVQMPKGIPVATVAINNSTNAALLAIRMLAISDSGIRDQVAAYALTMAEASRAKTLT